MTRRTSKGSNKNRRPSAAAGRALKTWMLAEFGDGISAPCAFCQRNLVYTEMTKDLFPRPARKGGRYLKGNVRPACLSCNARDGARQAAMERTEAKLKRDARLLRRRELYALKRSGGPQRLVEPLAGVTTRAA